jgi:hypothetical protein
MNDATLRRRIVVLVIATLLSVMAASATAAAPQMVPLHLRCKAPRLGSDRLTRAHSASTNELEGRGGAACLTDEIVNAQNE